MACCLAILERHLSPNGMSRAQIRAAADEKMNAVEDPKSGSESSAKSIALDHLGDIAARIRSLHAQMTTNLVPTFEEVISKADSEGVKVLLQAYRQVDINLSASAGEDDMYSVSPGFLGLSGC